ncbi:TatD family hydrolase [Methylococcus sp. EFPC2]|uniref:TatD family hydrolase n=1 Tax=Methylococcus sp. EFPC2 TaxID=2812648 RepID=UPI0019678BFA|nr:TatD family hydrolase [Methylococcus sp. EFPC2]QSA97399.1 TatD family hydrolase [Methylococcus sp. EFPC2]
MLIDSHCHLDRLDLAPYGHDFSRFVQETREAGVGHMLCVSISLEAYPAMRALAEGHDAISVSVGVHPNERDCHEPSVEDLVERATDPKVVAIGETGLDYFRSEGDLAWQHERFRTHIRAARAAGKPLIIHTRESREDTLRILEEEGAAEVGGVLHCFTEDWETARRALDLNFYISFSGIVTFRNAAQIQDAARRVPDDRFLVETDSPYLAPIPHRGKPNYPAYVRHVAEFVADLRQTRFETVCELSSENYRRLFGTAA